MRYFIGVLIAALMIGGIIIGYNYGKNSNGSNASNRSSSNAKVLDLSNKGLTAVTAAIYNQTDTTDLILSNNSIKTLPSEMGKMTDVVIFKIDHNRLEGSLIGEIRQMSKLRQLDLSHNIMTGIPAEIGQLTTLEILDYSYNAIDGLPNELANLKTNLRTFNLTGNPLSVDTINKLKSELPNTNIVFN